MAFGQKQYVENKTCVDLVFKFWWRPRMLRRQQSNMQTPQAIKKTWLALKKMDGKFRGVVQIFCRLIVESFWTNETTFEKNDREVIKNSIFGQNAYVTL